MHEEPAAVHLRLDQRDFLELLGCGREWEKEKNQQN